MKTIAVLLVVLAVGIAHSVDYYQRYPLASTVGVVLNGFINYSNGKAVGQNIPISFKLTQCIKSIQAVAQVLDDVIHEKQKTGHFPTLFAMRQGARMADAIEAVPKVCTEEAKHEFSKIDIMSLIQTHPYYTQGQVKPVQYLFNALLKHQNLIKNAKDWFHAIKRLEGYHAGVAEGKFWYDVLVIAK